MDDTDPIPAEAWEQETPVGGSYDGRSPATGIYVVPVGIGTVREVPTLAGTSGMLQASAAGGLLQVFALMSSDPHRRAIHLGGISGTPRVATAREIATTGGGLPIATGATPARLQYAGELYVVFPTATDAIGFLVELDQD